MTPFALFIALVSVGAGEGNYILATVLFPYTIFPLVLSVFYFQQPVSGTVEAFLLFFTAIQFPVYGLIFSLTNRRVLLATLLVAIHICVFVITFVLAYRSGFL